MRPSLRALAGAAPETLLTHRRTFFTGCSSALAPSKSAPTCSRGRGSADGSAGWWAAGGGTHPMQALYSPFFFSKSPVVCAVLPHSDQSLPYHTHHLVAVHSHLLKQRLLQGWRGSAEVAGAADERPSQGGAARLPTPRHGHVLVRPCPACTQARALTRTSLPSRPSDTESHTARNWRRYRAHASNRLVYSWRCDDYTGWERGRAW